MAATIKIKRGLYANLPSSGYAAGELFLTTDTKQLFFAFNALQPLEEVANLRDVLQIDNNLSDLDNSSTARTNLSVYSKAEIDAMVTGRTYVQVAAASTANLTLSGEQTIDGVALTAGDRVLAKDQTSADENGIYVVASGAWSRSTDADTADEVESLAVIVTGGTVNGDTTWICISVDITLGTDDIEFINLPGGGQVTAGEGLQKSGNEISLDVSHLDALGTGANDGDYLLVYDTSAGTHKKILKSNLIAELVSELYQIKYNSGDASAGYLADKVVGGDGITVGEGTGGDADKLQIDLALSEHSEGSVFDPDSDKLVYMDASSGDPPTTYKMDINRMLQEATIDGGTF